MSYPRSYHNLTLLPDGTVLASGGMTTSDGVDLSKAVLPAEIWDPATETWKTVASLTTGREYHSTALLLPDGRVLMAGGGQLHGSRDGHLQRRDLFAAVPVQGHEADDHERAVARQLRLELHRHDARRGEHPEGRAHPHAVRHARVRREPAVHPALVHARAAAS